MLDFYIITDCTERGLYRKARLAKRISQKYPEARIVRFQSPEDIPVAQEFCSKSGISVTAREWEELQTAGRLRLFAEKGVLPPPSETGSRETQQKISEKKVSLPVDAAAVIYTDGSYIEPDDAINMRVKQAYGGWAAVIILRDYYDARISLSGHTACPCKDHDSSYMEMLAVAKALKRLKKYDIKGKVMLYTDCEMLVTDYKAKLAGWAECGWQKPDGMHIKYWNLWRKIWRRTKDIDLQVHWVKGHAKNEYNNQCHFTAKAEAVMRKPGRKRAKAEG